MPSTAASSCKHCHGWALQVVLALWKVGTSVVQSSPNVNQHRDVPKLGTQGRDSRGCAFHQSCLQPQTGNRQVQFTLLHFYHCDNFSRLQGKELARSNSALMHLISKEIKIKFSPLLCISGKPGHPKRPSAQAPLRASPCPSDHAQGLTA